jgi:hypothetical protein
MEETKCLKPSDSSHELVTARVCRPYSPRSQTPRPAMPEVSGAAVIDHARTCQPGLKGLLITGYAEVLRTGGIPGIPVLPKPFKVAELSERIAAILNGSPSANSDGGSNALQ